MGKLAIKLWNYVLKGRKFEQSCISDWLSVSADISDPVSVIGISAKFHIGASLHWEVHEAIFWFLLVLLCRRGPGYCSEERPQVPPRYLQVYLVRLLLQRWLCQEGVQNLSLENIICLAASKLTSFFTSLQSLSSIYVSLLNSLVNSLEEVLVPTFHQWKFSVFPRSSTTPS